MADPIELPAADAACCVPVQHACTQNAIGQKLRQALCNLQSRVPDKFVNLEVWAHMTVSKRPGFGDEQTKVWVKIADNIVGAVFERRDRWFQSSIGVLEKTDIRIVVSGIYQIKPSYEVVLPHSNSMFVTNVTTEAGVSTLWCDKARSSFVRPARSTPGYRITGVGAQIL